MREGVARIERRTCERRGREGEDEMAQHGHVLSGPDCGSCPLQVGISSSLCQRLSSLKGRLAAPATARTCAADILGDAQRPELFKQNHA
jgi:hypothetical protein